MVHGVDASGRRNEGPEYSQRGRISSLIENLMGGFFSAMEES